MKMETSEFLQKLNNGDYKNHIIMLRHSDDLRTSFLHNNQEFESSHDINNEGSILYRPSSVEKILNLTKVESVDDIKFIICDVTCHSDSYFNSTVISFDNFANNNFTNNTLIVSLNGLRETEKYID